MSRFVRSSLFSLKFFLLFLEIIIKLDKKDEKEGWRASSFTFCLYKFLLKCDESLMNMNVANVLM